MRPVLLALLIASCSGSSRKADLQDCLAAVAAEKDRAAKEGHPPEAVVQKCKLTTDVLDYRNSPHITLEMAKEARTAKLKVLAQMSVRIDGSVEAVEVIKSSGSQSFDQEVAAKMKTWTFQPTVIDCRAVPDKFRMSWSHDFLL